MSPLGDDGLTSNLYKYYGGGKHLGGPLLYLYLYWHWSPTRFCAVTSSVLAGTQCAGTSLKCCRDGWGSCAGQDRAATTRRPEYGRFPRHSSPSRGLPIVSLAR